MTGFLSADDQPKRVSGLAVNDLHVVHHVLDEKQSPASR
jgi:hypothetical protein